MAYTWEVNTPASLKLSSDNPLGTGITFRGIDAAENDATVTNKGIKGLMWLTTHVDDAAMVTDDAQILVTAGAIRVINENVEETE